MYLYFFSIKFIEVCKESVIPSICTLCSGINSIIIKLLVEQNLVEKIVENVMIFHYIVDDFFLLS